MSITLPPSLSDEKPEVVPVSKLRVAEEVCWRKMLDLERTLCWSAAKTNQALFLGHMMVGSAYNLMYMYMYMRLSHEHELAVLCLLYRPAGVGQSTAL